jgi:hypothetical protein
MKRAGNAAQPTLLRFNGVDLERRGAVPHVTPIGSRFAVGRVERPMNRQKPLETDAIDFVGFRPKNVIEALRVVVEASTIPARNTRPGKGRYITVDVK